MPELPEVETVARQLAPFVVGRTLKAVDLYDPLLGKPPVRRVANKLINKCFRLGKLVTFVTEGNTPYYIGTHLRMTGRLLWKEDGKQKDKAHLRARFRFTDGSAVFFYDTRRFGTIDITDDRAALEPKGLDPTTDAFTAAKLTELIGKSRQPIKLWLLRQDRLVGIGNIYACEILFDAKIAPDRPAASLSNKELGAVHRATRKILERAIENCGTTFSDFQNAYGVTGSYQQYLKVYGREGERCSRRGCKGKVARVVQAQRSTFHCAECQR